MVASVSYTIFDGYNSTTNNADEIDGAGVNEPVWPVLFDTFIAITPLIINAAMMEAFDGCADITIPGVNNTIVIPHEPETIMIMGLR
jgi:hypothetical protein